MKKKTQGNLKRRRIRETRRERKMDEKEEQGGKRREINTGKKYTGEFES